MTNTKPSHGYIIEGVVEFWPETRKLIRRDNDKVEILHSPASACLHELIKNKPAVVSQKDLITAGWLEREKYVSLNTFYQNMLSLRQALANIGLGTKLIVTIRRQGLMIPERFNITPIDNPHNREGGIDNIEVGRLTSEHPSSAYSKKNFVAKSESTSKTKSKNLYYIMIIFTTILISTGIWMATKSQGNNFIKYHKLIAIKDCNIYVSNPIISIQEYNNFLIRNGLTCDKRKWWYISAFNNSQRISLIRCANDINTTKKNYCSTDFYYGDKYDF